MIVIMSTIAMYVKYSHERYFRQATKVSSPAGLLIISGDYQQVQGGFQILSAVSAPCEKNMELPVESASSQLCIYEYANAY